MDQLRFLLRYANVAPGAGVSPPWRFRVTPAAVHLYAAGHAAREHVEACGAALLNLRVALRRYGYATIVTAAPWRNQPDYLARVRVGPPVTPTLRDLHLFDAIERCAGPLRPIACGPLSPAIRDELVAAAAAEGARFAGPDADGRVRVDADGDARAHWLRAGQARQRVTLLAHIHGVDSLAAVQLARGA